MLFNFNGFETWINGSCKNKNVLFEVRSEFMRMSKKKREKYTRMMMVGICIVMVVMFVVPIIFGS